MITVGYHFQFEEMEMDKSIGVFWVNAYSGFF
jgi:hypothetical protein